MAALTSTAIANAALSKLGVAPILSVDPPDNTKKAKTMALWYPLSRDATIRIYPWNFAKERTQLAQLSTAPEWGWEYQYQLPVDPKCLRVLEMGETKDMEVEGYSIEGDKLLTDQETAYILYLKRVTDTEQFDPMFTMAFIYQLAHDACYDLMGSRSDEARLMTAAEFLKTKAGAMSGIESHQILPMDTTWRDAGRTSPARTG